MAKAKKKILVSAYGFFPAQQFGGPPVSIDNLSTHMTDFEVYIVTRNHELTDKTPLEGISEGWNDRGNCKVLYLSDADFTVKRIEMVIKEIKPSLVFIQTFYQAKTFMCAAFAARRQGIPVLLAPRGELCTGAMKKKYKKIPYINKRNPCF